MLKEEPREAREMIALRLTCLKLAIEAGAGNPPADEDGGKWSAGGVATAALMFEDLLTGKLREAAAPHPEDGAETKLAEAEKRIERLEETVVYGLFVDEKWGFCQGLSGANELCEPITAEQCQGWVERIVRLQAEVARLTQKDSPVGQDAELLPAKADDPR